MLARLSMELSANDLSYRNSSILQGILFEHIDSNYADELHKQSMHPYSQYLKKEDNKTYWVIQTLNQSAYENIIQPFINPKFSKFHMEKIDKEVSIVSRKLETLEKKVLLQEFNEAKAESEQFLHFISPTAFKRAGQIYILPDLRLVFQNIMNKYTASSEMMDMWDEETLEQLIDSSNITRYNIHSTVFPCEGININGFVGSIRISVKGTETLKRYVRFWVKFAEYSGIGIKTGMGMGAVKRIDKNER